MSQTPSPRTDSPPRRLEPKQVQLIASGDLRLSANQTCWPAQKAMEQKQREIDQKNEASVSSK